MQSLTYYLKNPKAILAGFVFHTNFFYPDSLYLRLMFWSQMGYKLNLKNPRTYSEKLQWIKLYDRNPFYTRLVDKIDVKYYIKERIGEEFIIKTLAIWNDVEDIQIDNLPNKFVLKTNCGGGSNGVIVCKDKNDFDIKEAKIKLKKSLNANIYKTHREWPYKNVKPRIFAEEYMVDESGCELKDYKFFCFGGKVKALFVATERYRGDHYVKFDYYDENFQHLDIRQSHLNSDNPLVVPPKNFEKMKQISEKLSEGLKHVRVDLYNINGRIYFGEMTFFHYSGLMPFKPKKWDYIWGNWLDLGI